MYAPFEYCIWMYTRIFIVQLCVHFILMFEFTMIVAIYCCWYVMSALSLVSWSLVVCCDWSCAVAMFSLRSHQRVYPAGVVLNRLTIPHVRHLTTMCFSLCANTHNIIHITHTYKLQTYIYTQAYTWMHTLHSINT